MFTFAGVSPSAPPFAINGSAPVRPLLPVPTPDPTPAVRDRPDAIDPGRLSGLVEFHDVSFSYDGKRAAVEDLSFTALPGQTIALVGPTGAGKSTAIALLHRAFDPQSGIIKIDGMDVRGLTLTALRRNIGVVFQEALLFNRSIADNLRVGKPDATEEEMRKAAERAQALEFIERGDQDPRRGDQRARRGHRGQGQCGAGRGDEGPHHLRHRAPPVDHPQCHAHSGVPERPRHRDGNF